MYQIDLMLRPMTEAMRMRDKINKYIKSVQADVCSSVKFKTTNIRIAT